MKRKTLGSIAADLREVMKRDGLDSTSMESAARELEWAARHEALSNAPAVETTATAKGGINMTHYGDPCIHCGIPHDDVPSGPCHGDSSKATPIAYRQIGIRRDGVAHYLILMSTGQIEDRWEHAEMDLPHTYLKGVRYDHQLRRPRDE